MDARQYLPYRRASAARGASECRCARAPEGVLCINVRCPAVQAVYSIRMFRSCGPGKRRRGVPSGRGARVVSLLSHSQKNNSQITILHEPRNSQPASLITRAGPHARHTPFAILNSHVLIALSPGDARTSPPTSVLIECHLSAPQHTAQGGEARERGDRRAPAGGAGWRRRLAAHPRAGCPVTRCAARGRRRRARGAARGSCRRPSRCRCAARCSAPRTR